MVRMLKFGVSPKQPLLRHWRSHTIGTASVGCMSNRNVSPNKPRTGERSQCNGKFSTFTVSSRSQASSSFSQSIPVRLRPVAAQASHARGLTLPSSGHSTANRLQGLPFILALTPPRRAVPLKSNVSLRCRNSMQCIRFVVAERQRCARLGATPAPARAVRPAAASVPPARLGLSHGVHRASVHRQNQPRSRLATLIAPAQRVSAPLQWPRFDRVLPFATTVGHDRWPLFAV